MGHSIDFLDKIRNYLNKAECDGMVRLQSLFKQFKLGIDVTGEVIIHMREAEHLNVDGVRLILKWYDLFKGVLSM